MMRKWELGRGRLRTEKWPNQKLSVLHHTFGRVDIAATGDAHSTDGRWFVVSDEMTRTGKSSVRSVHVRN